MSKKTESNKPKRKPAGAAVAGAVDRPVHYPKTFAQMISNETYDAICITAAENDVSKAEVARDWLEAGRLGIKARYVDES